MEWVFLILGGMLGTLGSLLAGALDRVIGDRLHSLLLKVFPGGWVPKKYLSLKGRWKACWQGDSPNYPSAIVDAHAEIKQWGNRIVAFMSSTIPEKGFRCRLEGTIENQHTITGLWYDEVADGPSYYGAFQFIYDRATGNFSGKWIGFSQRGDVKDGRWEWTRRDAALPAPMEAGTANERTA